MSVPKEIKGTITINLPDFIESQNKGEHELFVVAQEDFINCTRTLIQGLIKILTNPRIENVEESGRCIVVFPLLSQWAMYLTENIVRECYTSLTYFLVGPLNAKRIVICHEDLIQRKIMQDTLAQMNMKTTGESNVQSDVVVEQHQKEEHRNEKLRKPDKPIYIPKALREEKKSDTAEVSAEINKFIGNKILDETVTEDNTEPFQPEEDSVWTKLAYEHLLDIYSTVGSVFIIKPDWSEFGIGSDIACHLDSSNLGHLLEVFDFPTTFTEKDISNIFQDFRDSGFCIHWTDDTHALIRFPNKDIATEALATIRHSSLKCRPISIASRKTKVMLVKCHDKTLPFKYRPKTETIAAKRLILTSLGISPGKISK